MASARERPASRSATGTAARGTVSKPARRTEGVAASPASAVTYLEKACAQKEIESCFRLGHLYAAGDKGVPRDVAKAIPLLTTACDGGRGQACDELSRYAERGDGLPKDHANAIALLAKGCAAKDFQSWTCGSLKQAYDGKDQEAVKAIAAWKRGCAAKDAAACAGLDRVGVK